MGVMKLEKEFTLKDLMDIMQENNVLLRILVRQKQSNKLQKLMDEVQKKGRMCSRQVDVFLGVSRNWAINLMSKLGEEHGFRFSKGNINQKRSSVVIFDKSLIIKDQNKKIEDLLNSKETVTFSDLMSELRMDISELMMVVDDFVNHNKDYQIIDNNKLVRVNGTFN